MFVCAGRSALACKEFLCVCVVVSLHVKSFCVFLCVCRS